MISNYMVIGGIGLLCRAAILWGRKVLPKERWQFFASVPVSKGEGGEWHAVNITWYGLILASSAVFAIALCLVMLGAVGVPLSVGLLLIALLLLVCVPASSLVARMVEGKRATLTIGGAAFVGGIIAPFLVLLLNRFAGGLLGAEIPMEQALAACAVSFLLGEGMGRLACLSYGCCYGRPVDDYRGMLGRFFRWSAVVFEGENKKISYASGLGGRKVAPIQLLTMLASSWAGIATLVLYAEGRPLAAYLGATAFAGFWRIISEFFRNDYRGGGRISAYQIMSVLSIVYAAAVALYPHGRVPTPFVDLFQGVQSLWSPAVLTVLFAIWCGLVLFAGVSRTTYSRVSFHLHRDRI